VRPIYAKFTGVGGLAPKPLIMDNIFSRQNQYMALNVYPDTFKSCQNLLPTLSVRYARRLNPLKCAYFDRLQAAGILIKGLLSKCAKLTILKNLALNKTTRGPNLP